MILVSAERERIRCPIRFEPGVLGRAGLLLRAAGAPRDVLVVTDRTVLRLHGARFLAGLRRAGLRPRVTALPPGERWKSLATVRALCERWAGWRVDRSQTVLALGGGVVSDVAGFAAAAYARGLDWYAFPTTVLAQADASIGGKVGVNLLRSGDAPHALAARGSIGAGRGRQGGRHPAPGDPRGIASTRAR